jgi:hypothetical protein
MFSKTTIYVITPHVNIFLKKFEKVNGEQEFRMPSASKLSACRGRSAARRSWLGVCTKR